MRALILVFSALVVFGLSGCKGSACKDGGVYTCKRWERRTSCGATPRGDVICRDERICLIYGCVKSPVDIEYEASFPASALGLGEKPVLKLRDLSTSGAMSLIANGDMLAAQSMGFELNDIFALLNGQSLSKARLQSIARVTDESEAVVARKVESINAEFQTQRHDFKSPYWQTCVASGRWSTDQNSRCEKSFWPGCSPEQGASLCMSDVGAGRFGL